MFDAMCCAEGYSSRDGGEESEAPYSAVYIWSMSMAIRISRIVSPGTTVDSGNAIKVLFRTISKRSTITHVYPLEPVPAV